MADNPLPTRLWDAAEHLKSDENIGAYLDAALAEGDPALVAAVLDDIARARGMTQSARTPPNSIHPLPSA
jgi:probable addiction module antidote protein